MSDEERALLEEFKRTTYARRVEDAPAIDDFHDEGDSYEQDHPRIER
jgi:hypothetical protein